jgi:hypothetical protein
MKLVDLLDLPAYFDPIDRIEGLISTFLNADWARARKGGPLGILKELLSCAVSYNAPTVYVSRYSIWRGIDIERLLRRHGVKVWDRGIAGEDLYFCVKRRQVRWAEYLLLRAGVPVMSALKEPRNRQWTARYQPGSEPPSGHPSHRRRPHGRPRSQRR